MHSAWNRDPLLPRREPNDPHSHRESAAARLSTRLLLPLVGAVTVVMFGLALWARLRREGSLVGEARRETETHAIALCLALEEAFRDPDQAQVQQVIDRVSQEGGIYAILVWDSGGNVLFPFHYSHSPTKVSAVKGRPFRSPPGRWEPPRVASSPGRRA